MFTKIRPAIFKIQGMPWAWVELKELSDILGISAMEVMKNFGLLSKDIWTISVIREGIFITIDLTNTMPVMDDVYVPAGWAQDVVKAAEEGFSSVEVVYHQHLSANDKCPKGSLACRFDGSGFVSVVGRSK